MSNYILVHGAWEESRMWDEVSPVLQQAGHKVTAIDLPGHGVNKQPGQPVTTADYLNALVAVIKQEDQPVILVAHSMNGALVSQVAELIPDRIERLVYVTSFLLKDGGSVLAAMESDEDGQALPEILFSDDQAYATLPQAALRRVGFHDVDEQTIERVLPIMAEWQSSEPFMAQVKLSAESFGSVPKTYVRTNADRMVTPALQEIMIANWEVDSVFELESGHFPSISVPAELADVLLKTALLTPARRVSNA